MIHMIQQLIGQSLRVWSRSEGDSFSFLPGKSCLSDLVRFRSRFILRTTAREGADCSICPLATNAIVAKIMRAFTAALSLILETVSAARKASSDRSEEHTS